MRVAVRGHHGVVGALALAEVGLVLLGVEDPVPAVVLLEVDGVVPQAAARLVHVRFLSANLVHWLSPSVARPCLPDVHLKERRRLGLTPDADPELLLRARVHLDDDAQVLFRLLEPQVDNLPQV